MLKKKMFLIAPLAPLAAVAAIASAPTAAMGDTVCTTPTPSNPTPICQQVCIVPQVIGQKLSNARVSIQGHDCRVGKITLKGKRHKKGFRRTFRIVVNQNPKAHGIFAAGTAVNLTVRWRFKKVHHHH